MSGFPPPPPGLDINESMQTNITAAIFITWAASLIFIALRFTARRLSKAGFWWDDWLILPAAVTSTASTWVTWSMMIRHGVGRHIWALPMPPDFTDFLKGLFIVEVLYTIELLLVKFSILAFYWRIFRVSSIKIPIYIIAFIVFGWAVGQECAIFLQSVPLNSIWDKSITPTSSINDFTFFYASAIPSIVTDFACLILPMPYIWKLQVSRAQKLGIMLMFALGSFVVAVSFIRLAYLVNQDLTSIDYFWNVTNGHIWSIVELNTAVISVTLPSLRPVYTWARTTPLLSYYGLLSKRTGTSGSGTGFSSKTPYNGSRSGTYGRRTAGNDDDPDDNTGLFSRLPSSEVGSNTKVGFKNDVAVANDEVIEMEEGRGKSWPGVRVTSDVSVSYGKR